MRAVVTTKTTKFNIEGDFFKVDEKFLVIQNGKKTVALVELETLVEAHLSEERKL